jgi:hypothetical protein
MFYPCCALNVLTLDGLADMTEYADRKTQAGGTVTASGTVPLQDQTERVAYQADLRPETSRLRHLQAAVQGSRRLEPGSRWQTAADRHTGSGLPVQRKTLEIAGLHTQFGVASTGRGKILGANAHDGLIYSAPAHHVAPTRADVLKESSRLAADVGKGVQEWAAGSRDRRGKNGRIYTVDGFDRPEVPTVDPFIHETVFSYGDREAGTGGDFSISYQHSNDLDGYVSSIVETPDGKPGLSGGMEKGKQRFSEAASVLRYSHLHEAHSGSLLDATAPATVARFDPITKLAGEGARFNCVRNHMAKLKDDSIFYTKENDHYRGISFKHLYVIWTTQFGGRFGITDKDVADKIRDKESLSGTKRGGKKRPAYPLLKLAKEELSDKDYDLDR